MRIVLWHVASGICKWILTQSRRRVQIKGMKISSNYKHISAAIVRMQIYTDESRQSANAGGKEANDNEGKERGYKFVILRGFEKYFREKHSNTCSTSSPAVDVTSFNCAPKQQTQQQNSLFQFSPSLSWRNYSGRAAQRESSLSFVVSYSLKRQTKKSSLRWKFIFLRRRLGWCMEKVSSPSSSSLLRIILPMAQFRSSVW